MTPIEKARNLGPVCAAEFATIGIHSLEQIVELGWEEVMVRWVQAYPERANLNAATALIGAIEDVDWRKVRPSDKAAARQLISELKLGRL
ncbi:MAG TPA: TfoX/Sxy family DNA transformation protein [Clostridia bacterium]|nr:TfoX/Sxy family DNA transformation protein [Clostridia bacterium]